MEAGHDIGDPTRASFLTSVLDYELPASFVAQQPAARREDASLLIVDRRSGTLHDGRIADLPQLLRPGDLLVLNDTKVLAAKFTALRATGGVVPGLFIAAEQSGHWRVMLQGSRRLRTGELLTVPAVVGDPVTLTLEHNFGEGEWRVRVAPDDAPEEILTRIGRTPLPPYIRRDNDAPMSEAEDRARYQTVYASRPGAIAAPTAGLHLTDTLLQRLRDAAVETAFVTLHVGVGTFKPITAHDLSRHEMHVERYELTERAADAVRDCRKRHGRTIAVGTTSVRVLESAASGPVDDRLVQARCGNASLFIYPPFEFRVVDALLTNFHLPRSTLLALVMAFAGVELTRRAYRHAIDQGYRFYSYGDAMLIQ